MKDIGTKPLLEKGVYRHYKGGIYEVIEVACNSETLEWCVVYQSKERERTNLPSVWLRPYSMFIENVMIDGETMPRFEKM